MRRILLGLVAASTLAGALATTAAASHSWSNYHWARTANPFTLKLGDNVDTSWDAYLQTTSTDWSASTVLKTSIVAGGTTGRRCRATSGRVEVCNASYGKNGWLGLASISATSAGHITQGTAKMNDTYMTTPTYDTPIWRGMVMCQEVGHTFGLDHQDTSGANLHTCMDYASTPDTSNTHPNQHDYDQLVTIYSHTDSSSTVASAPAALAASEGASPAHVERVDDIRSSTTTETFRDGSRRVTTVVWALPS